MRSIELNLNPAGEGDMEPQALAELDIVIGCFHSALRRKEDQTERYLAALRNPTIQILGHPRGRIYNYRAGLSADWPRVFALAAELDKAVEIDAYPDRQDLSPDLLHAGARRRLPDFIWDRCPRAKPVAVYGVRRGLGAASRHRPRTHLKFHVTRTSCWTGFVTCADATRHQDERTELKWRRRKAGGIAGGPSAPLADGR